MRGARTAQSSLPTTENPPLDSGGAAVTYFALDRAVMYCPTSQPSNDRTARSRPKLTPKSSKTVPPNTPAAGAGNLDSSIISRKTPRMRGLASFLATLFLLIHTTYLNLLCHSESEPIANTRKAKMGNPKECQFSIDTMTGSGEKLTQQCTGDSSKRISIESHRDQPGLQLINPIERHRYSLHSLCGGINVSSLRNLP